MRSGLQTTLSRRDFLKGAATGATLGAAAGLLIPPAAHAGEASGAGETSAGQSWSVLIDLTRCTGCNACVLACKKSNHLPDPDTISPALDSDAFTCIETRQVTTAGGETQPSYVKRQCMNCLHPACASACTVGALYKTPEGPVAYDTSKCIGCRYCQYACPFGVPTYEWEQPLGLIRKCQFCRERLDSGQGPACAGACPNGALRFGRREELLAQAHAQIISNSGRYVDHVYGEHEVGGTAMLYLSAVPFVELGFPELGPQPAPQHAEAVMKQTPLVALTVATLTSALAWFLKRREQKLTHLPANIADSQESS